MRDVSSVTTVATAASINGVMLEKDSIRPVQLSTPIEEMIEERVVYAAMSLLRVGIRTSSHSCVRRTVRQFPGLAQEMSLCILLVAD